MLQRLLVLLVLFAAACGSSSSDSTTVACPILTAKACTEHPACILDGSPGAPSCRAATSCELRLTSFDARSLKLTGDDMHRAIVNRCEADATCRYEDRGCFCPCNLSGFPACACACGGGLPARCTERR